MHLAISRYGILNNAFTNIFILTVFGSLSYFHGKNSEEWYKSILPNCPPTTLS